MSLRFIADPPLQVKRGSLKKHLWHLLCNFGWILRCSVVPFKSQPEAIDALPAPNVKVTESHVKQCQWIFDQALARRVHLEQKAQSTFGLMLFLVPLLASLFVFVISKFPVSHGTPRRFAISLLGLAAVLLLLGFTSAVRAISVKAIETLFLRSVIDERGQIREYKEAFHVRGLLYCAAMNEGLNDHIAQFVKGAHVLTAAAVIALFGAAVPTSYVFSGLPSSPTDMKIVGLGDLIASRDDVAKLKGDIGKLLSNSRSGADDLKRLEEHVAEIDAKLTTMQKATPARQRQP